MTESNALTNVLSTALRAEVFGVSSHKSWHRAARHLAEVAASLRPATVIGLTCRLIDKKPKRRNREVWEALRAASQAALKRRVEGFVEAVGKDAHGVEELRRYHPVFRELVDEASARTKQ